MKSVLNFVKNNKIKFFVAIILVIIIAIIGTYQFLESNKRKYSLTEVSNYNYFILKIDSLYGVIDVTGNVIIEPNYKNVTIPNPEKGVFICEKEDNSIVLNEKGEEIFTEYEEVSAILLNGIVSNIPYEKTVLRYKDGDKYGIITYDEKVITKPIYEEIKGLENKESELLVKTNGKYGVINAKGAMLIKAEYDSIVADGFYTDEEKYALSGYIVSNKTEDGYRYGYINNKYKKVLDVQYNTVERILDSKNEDDVCLIASKNGKYGVLKNNKELINFSYQGIEYDSNNAIFELDKNGKYGIIDYSGKSIVPIEYTGIEIKGIYILAYKNDEEIIYYNLSGEVITDLKYASILNTQNENYFITINEEGFYGIINAQNEELVGNKYNFIEYLFDDYFIVANQNGSLGVINSIGDVKIDIKYDVLQKIEDTNVIEAKILKDSKTYYYSKNLELVYSAKNAYIYKEDAYLKIYTQLEDKYLNFDGVTLDSKEVLNNNSLLSSKKDDKWGFVDRNGNVVVDYQYDKVTEFNEYGFAGIKVDNKWGVIDLSGNIIQEPIYELEQENLQPEFLGKFYKVYYGYGESYYTK